MIISRRLYFLSRFLLTLLGYFCNLILGAEKRVDASTFGRTVIKAARTKIRNSVLRSRSAAAAAAAFIPNTCVTTKRSNPWKCLIRRRGENEPRSDNVSRLSPRRLKYTQKYSKYTPKYNNTRYCSFRAGVPVPCRPRAARMFRKYSAAVSERSRTAATAPVEIT